MAALRGVLRRVYERSPTLEIFLIDRDSMALEEEGHYLGGAVLGGPGETAAAALVEAVGFDAFVSQELRELC